MKKLFSIFAIFCLTATIMTSCGGSSWNQERAQELASIPTAEVTPDQFDEMLTLIKAGWDITKQENTDNETEEEKDKRREFARLYLRLGAQARSVAHAHNRVISDSQVEKYETLVEDINNEMREITRRNAEKYK